MELTTPRLKIREFMESDYDSLREMDMRPEFITFERESAVEADTRSSLDESISSQQQIPRTMYRLAITISPSDKVNGVINIHRQQEKIREWEVGWAVHPDEWSKGYATEAAWHIIDWAFQELNLHRIVAYCHAENAASLRVMQKLGMHLEGKMREVRWLNGAWWDEYVYGILDKEWQKIDFQDLEPHWVK